MPDVPPCPLDVRLEKRKKKSCSPVSPGKEDNKRLDGRRGGRSQQEQIVTRWFLSSDLQNGARRERTDCGNTFCRLNNELVTTFDTLITL